MNIDDHESFRRMIDESLAAAISAQKEQSLREHLVTCASCLDYRRASYRVIEALSGFSFEVNPTLNASVLVALKRRAQGEWAARPDRHRLRHERNVQIKVGAALAAALSMSIVGSALVYQVAKMLTVPMYFGTAQIRAGVIVFWLLPSFCSALSLLAAPGKNRGFA